MFANIAIDTNVTDAVADYVAIPRVFPKAIDSFIHKTIRRLII